MFSILLNLSLSVLFFSFAFSASRADIHIVAVAAAMLGLWTISGMIQAIRRLMSQRHHDPVDE